jgi:D-3-phosphoglycerate dehydrogenase
MTPLVVYADAHLFSPTTDDFRRVEDAGYLLTAVDGHQPRDFAPFGAEAVALLAWGGTYSTESFDMLPRLRVLARCGAGYDNIDLSAADERGIALTYVPGASDHEVAEHTVALLLGAARKIATSDRAVRTGGWPSSAALAPMIRVHGSTLGLVGFGRIARAVAGKSHALGMQVQALDPFVDPSVFAEAGVTGVESLSDLLGQADFVSLHVPGGADRRALIGSAEFDSMRANAVLINTARGSLVDTEALVEALRSGRIAGAALDVLEPEPVPAGHPLLTFDNVVITPHSAAFSAQALATLRSRALDDIFAVLAGRQPVTPIPRKD